MISTQAEGDSSSQFCSEYVITVCPDSTERTDKLGFKPWAEVPRVLCQVGHQVGRHVRRYLLTGGRTQFSSHI